MNIISVNTGTPKSYTLDGVTLETSMVRSPQPKIQVEFKKVVGDIFKNPSFHGVPEAAVYAFSTDRYDYWSRFLGSKVGTGFFGENLSVDFLREEDFYLNDEYQAGSAILKVTGPRYPCNRLNFVSGNQKTRDHFAEKAWPGVYFEVLQEGEIKAGDKLFLKKRIQNEITVLDLFMALYNLEKREPINEKIRNIKKSPHVLERYKTRLKKFYIE
jgi:MOSC domain-containing protein YiiM